MLSTSALLTALLCLRSVSGFGQMLPRSTVSFSNSTSSSIDPAPTCCYLYSEALRKVVWSNVSISVTVATVSTIVFQYDNTAVTSYKTIQANYSVPTGLVLSQPQYSQLPTDLIAGGGPYDAQSTFLQGTVFTDPYGVTYPSPTQVWFYDEVDYVIGTPSTPGGPCPTMVAPTNSIGVEIYPSGFYLADKDYNATEGIGDTGELFTAIPTELRDWMVTHVPPSASTSTFLSHLATCTTGGGDGIPIAHIPVNSLTAAALTTSTIAGNLGATSNPPSQSPGTTSTPPAESPPPTTSVPIAHSSVPSAGNTPQPASSNSPASGNPPASNPAAGNGNIPSPSSNSPQASTPPAGTTQVPPTNGGSSSNNAGSGSNDGGSGSNNAGSGSNTAAPGSNNGGSGSNNAGTGQTNQPNGGAGTQPTAAGQGNQGQSQGSQPTLAPAPGSGNVQPGASAAFTAGGSTIVGNPSSGFVIGGSTLTPGGTVVLKNGNAAPTTYALPTSADGSPANAVVINGASQTFQSVSGPATSAAPAPAPFIVAGSSTIQANSASAFVIGSQTLTPGGTITVSSAGSAPTTYALPTSGGSVIVNGSPTPINKPAVVFGSSTITANSASGYVVAGQTLTAGGVVTVSGTTLSLSGSSVVAVSGTQGIGGVINSMGGFQTGSPSGTPSNYVQASGADRMKVGLWGMACGLLAVLLL